LSNPSTAADGHVVTIHYTLTASTGEVLDTSRDGDPFAYLHGAENIVPGLERQLAGKSVGDKLQAVVPPAEGYGEKDPAGVLNIQRSQLPADAPIEPGLQLVMQEHENAPPQPIWVTAVDGDAVVLDRNHPLAGVTLHFDVEVMEIRDATAEERAHGHPHGPGDDH